MLIQFNVTNYRSIAETQTLNLSACYNADELGENLIQANLPGIKNMSFVKSMALYGANASGKSNLVQALTVMKNLVCDSATDMKPDSPIPVTPFLLSSDYKEQPSEFEAIFAHEGIRYQYGFSVTRKRVLAEWLYAWPKGRQKKIFSREYLEESDSYQYEYGTGNTALSDLTDKTRPNALFVSAAAQFNAKPTLKVYSWFNKHLQVLDLASAKFEGLLPYTVRMIKENESEKDRVVNLLQQADLGISDISIMKKPVADMLPEDMPTALKKKILAEIGESQTFVPTFFHTSANDKAAIKFDLQEESLGTQRFFALMGPWVDILSNDITVVIDEISASMHPMLTQQLIRMIHQGKSNAQLIFTTHNTALLDKELLRRDQVWFTEKDRSGKTNLYPLSDYKPRKEESLEKGYLAGRYGAIPFLTGEFSVE